MRSFTKTTFTLALSLPVLFGFGCAPGVPAGSPANPSATVGSVVGIYVPTGSTAVIPGMSDEVRRSYRAGAGFYVRPHLVVTDIGLFPRRDGVLYYSTDDTLVSDGGHTRVRATDITVTGRIVLIRTAEAGRPLILKEGTITVGESLDVRGFHFLTELTATVAAAHAYRQPTLAGCAPVSFDANRADEQFCITTAAEPGIAGSPVLDADGHVAGMADQGFPGDRTTVVSAAAIRAAIEGEDS